MAHLRSRHALEVVESLLKFSPLVGVFGHRQVGKTTFLEKVCASYRTFDDPASLKSAENDAGAFVRNLEAQPAGIDESQLCPPLFPALKEHVRKHKKPGQILLSGSVRFYSRKAIRESLTGRIVNLDMLPLVLTELAEQERARFGLALIKKASFGPDLESFLPSRKLGHRSKLIDLYAEQGGLPGVCFIRNERLRSERLREQLNLILDRDLRLVYPSTLPYSQLLEFVSRLAEMEGEPVQPSILRRLSGVSEATQKKVLQALEAVFLIRLLPVEGDRRGVAVYFEDQAERRSLLLERDEPARDFEGLVYRNLRATFSYELGCDFRVFQYRAQRDVRIPFAIKTKEGCLGILPILEAKPSRSQLRMAHRFLQRYSPAAILIVTHGQADTVVLEPRILQLPAERLLFEE